MRVFELGALERIPLGEGRAFMVAGRQVAVFRTRAGEVYATQAYCPHQSGPLADGIVGGRRVICPLHGFRFDLSTGRPLDRCGALRTYPVEVDAFGRMWLEVNDEQP